MAYTAYDTILLIQDALDALSTILTVAQKQPNSARFPTARLHEDMKPLSFQVLTATRYAARIVARLTGTDPGDVTSPVETFEDMSARINMVKQMIGAADKDFVTTNAVKPQLVNMAEGKILNYSAEAIIFGSSVPSIFFHVVTAYGILRKEGVPLGRLDYDECFQQRFSPIDGSTE